MVTSSRPSADVNRTAILAHLGVHGPASRADLARGLEVSPPLITQLTRDLLADGLIQELSESTHRGGRPARMLGLVSTGLAAIGVKIAPDHIALVEAGIDGSVRRSRSESFDALSPIAITVLGEVIGSFAADADPGTVILGVGVGLPGSVARQDEGIVDSTQLGWSQVALGSLLRRALALPVVVENNVNALAIAEKLFGEAHEVRDALVVTIGDGVGAAILAEGLLLRGRGGGAGDFGHTPVREGGPLCQCGNRGCLEAIIGQSALVNDARSIRMISEAEGIDALRALAESGDAGAREIFANAGHQLGRALAGMMNMLDPELVVLQGEGVLAWTHWATSFELALRGALVPGKRGIPVHVEDWADERWALGAAALVLATPFDAGGVSGEQGRLVRERLGAPSPVQA